MNLLLKLWYIITCATAPLCSHPCNWCPLLGILMRSRGNINAPWLFTNDKIAQCINKACPIAIKYPEYIEFLALKKETIPYLIDTLCHIINLVYDGKADDKM